MGSPPGSRRAVVCQLAAYQPEKPPLSRRLSAVAACSAARPILLCMGLFSIFCVWPGKHGIVRAMPPGARPRHRGRKQDLDQRAGPAAGLDLEFGAVGFDE